MDHGEFDTLYPINCWPNAGKKQDAHFRPIAAQLNLIFNNGDYRQLLALINATKPSRDIDQPPRW